MFRRSTEPAAPAGWTPAPGEPHDSCFRCGRPTPLGVSLCAQDNPGRVKAPSATQVHGTIALGVVGGFIGFALLATLITSGVGPFVASITGQATHADGSLEVVVRVTNDGTRTSAASCRVSRGTVQGASDLVFFTELIPVGETRDFTHVFAAPVANQPGPGTGPLAVRCN